MDVLFTDGGEPAGANSKYVNIRHGCCCHSWQGQLLLAEVDGEEGGVLSAGDATYLFMLRVAWAPAAVMWDAPPLLTGGGTTSLWVHAKQV